MKKALALIFVVLIGCAASERPTAATPGPIVAPAPIAPANANANTDAEAPARTAQPSSSGPAAKIGAMNASGQPVQALSLELVATLAGSITEDDVSPNGDAVICAGKDGELAVHVLSTGAERRALVAGDEILAFQKGTYLLKRGGQLVARRAFDGIEITGSRPPKSDVEGLSVSADGTRYGVMTSLPSTGNGMMRAKLTVFETKTNRVLGTDIWGQVAAGGIVEASLAPSGTAIVWSHTRGPTIERNLATKAEKTITDTQSRFYSFADGLRVRTPENPGFFAPKDQRVWIEKSGKRTVLETKPEDAASPRVAYAEGLQLLLLSTFNGDMTAQTIRVFDVASGKEGGRFALPGDSKVIYARGTTVLVAIEEKDRTPLYRLVR